MEIDYETLMVAWLKEKILYEIGQDDFALKALNMVREEIENSYVTSKKSLSKNLSAILEEIDALKAKLDTISTVRQL